MMKKLIVQIIIRRRRIPGTWVGSALAAGLPGYWAGLPIMYL